jgi:hypothetical protein
MIARPPSRVDEDTIPIGAYIYMYPPVTFH